MTDIEKFQAAEEFESWKRHPYTKVIFDFLNKKLNNSHLTAENSNVDGIKLSCVEEARIIRSLIKDFSVPIGLKIVVSSENKQQHQ